MYICMLINCIVYRRMYALRCAEGNSTEPCIEYCFCLVHCVVSCYCYWSMKACEAVQVLSMELFPCLNNSCQFCNRGLLMVSVAASVLPLTEWRKHCLRFLSI